MKFQSGLKKEREHAHRLCCRISVNFSTKMCVLRPGCHSSCNRNNISDRWAGRNFSPGWNLPCNQALRPMANFSLGRNFASPIKLKCCFDYMINLSPGAKSKFAWENLLRCENTVDARAYGPYSTLAEISFRLHGIFAEILARLTRMKTM